MTRSSTDRAGSDVLHAFFAHVGRRMHALAAMRGAAAGIAITTLWLARDLVLTPPVNDPLTPVIPALLPAILTLAIGAAAGAVVGTAVSRSRRHRLALEIERRLPDSRNLLLTAYELVSPTTDARGTAASSAPSDDVAGLVVRRAVALSRTLNLPRVFPSARATGMLAAAVVFAAVLVTVGITTSRGAIPQGVRALSAAVTGDIDILRVDVRINAPAYTGRESTSLRDPQRIDALRGSAVTLTVTSHADSVIATTRQGTQPLTRAANGNFLLPFSMEEDGFVTLEPRTVGGATGTRRLIGISVRADESPRVRILEPTQDIIVPDARRTLRIRIDADDDMAVHTLQLRYTKVSGSGERFTFSEGEVPVRITKRSAALWSGQAALALEPLLQEPGDLVVYRAVVTDSRPGSTPVESDALIAELASPGGLAALGFSLDPDEDRYGLSQQMVILKTEKLLARQKSMTAEAVTEEAMQLASEQRRVRAEFVFMMGGEFAQEISADNSMGDLDETHEAESESDLSAGRMANRGRSALLAAVRAMSRASSALSSSEIATALASEKAALKQLQEAFARSRFLMRALSQREQLDLTRRLSGRLDSIARSRSAVPDGDRDVRLAALRAVLADVLTANTETMSGRETLVRLAERVLQIDATSPATQRVATLLNAVGRTATTGVESARRSAARDSAAIELTRLLRDGTRPAPVAPAPAEYRKLQRELDAITGGVRGASPLTPPGARP